MTHTAPRWLQAAALSACALLIACEDDAPEAPAPTAEEVVEEPEEQEQNYNDQVDPTDDDGRSLYFYYGPMKLMLGESILYSIAAITGHSFGNWDFTAPDPAATAFTTAGNDVGEMYRHCRLLGGCMEHRIPQPRTSFVGTAYVLELEKAVAEACYDRAAFGMFPGNVAPDATVQVVTLIEHQYRAAYAAVPNTTDLERSIAYFDGHITAPEFTDVSPLESAGRGHCRALLTTNRFLFY
jgi:hypothetical protein